MTFRLSNLYSLTTASRSSLFVKPTVFTYFTRFVKLVITHNVFRNKSIVNNLVVAVKTILFIRKLPEFTPP